jgi:hypothetical protein
MELKAENFVLKLNNNQKKTKNNPKASERKPGPRCRGFVRNHPGACTKPLYTFCPVRRD